MDKVRLVPLNINKGSTKKPRGIENRQEVYLQKYYKKPILNNTSRFNKFLKPQLATFAQGLILKPKQLERIIINKALTYQEQELL